MIVLVCPIDRLFMDATNSEGDIYSKVIINILE